MGQRRRRLLITLIILLGTVSSAGVGTASAAVGEITSPPVNQAVHPSTSQIATTHSEHNESTAEATQRGPQETTLDAQLTPSNISFTDPGRITGRLALANGSGIDGRLITVSVGTRNYTVQTISNGRFQLPYRPVAMNASTARISVTYHPSREGYLSASDNVSANIEPVTAYIEVSEKISTVKYNDQLRINGRVVVEDTNQVVPGLPVTIQAGGRELTQVTTEDNGKLNVTTTFPANIISGEQTLQLQTTRSRAVQLQNSQTIRVGITSTQIDVWVANRSLYSIEIAGRLRASYGKAIANQPITVSSGSQTVQIDTTNNGTFTASLDLSRGSLGKDNDTVTITSTGRFNTNLAPASAFIPVPPESVESTYGATSAFENPSSDQMLVIFVAIISGGTMVAVGGYRGWVNSRSYNSDETNPVMSQSSVAVSRADMREDTEYSVTFIISRKRLNRGAVEQAVSCSYGRVWDELRTRVETDPQSHWELYDAVKSTSLDVDKSLYTLITVHQQVACSPDTINFLQGRIAIEAAETVYTVALTNSESDK